MKKVLVIGGGIIGLSCAYYLRRAGCEVTILDPAGGREGASYGNAGFLGPSHYTPLANPKSLRNGLRWMLSPTSPFYIQPVLDKDLIRWGLLFARHANQGHVDRMVKPLSAISHLSHHLFEQWHAAFPEFTFEKAGLIDLFQTEAAWQSAMKELSRARELGVDAVEISREDIAALEPDVEIRAAGGIHMRGDAHTYPPKLMEALLEELRRLGVQILETRATALCPDRNRIRSVQCGGEFHEADEIVLASGFWSQAIAQTAGVDIPLRAGRGYSLTYPLSQLPLRHSLYLNEVSVALTPMNGDKVRVGGTMEIVPVGTPPRMSRIEGILKSAESFLPHTRFPRPKITDAWFGYRPCAADGVPTIGRTRKFDNLTIATGHSMLGLGLAPATGKLVSEIILEQPPSIPIAPFSPDRLS